MRPVSESMGIVATLLPDSASLNRVTQVVHFAVRDHAEAVVLHFPDTLSAGTR